MACKYTHCKSCEHGPEGDLVSCAYCTPNGYERKKLKFSHSYGVTIISNHMHGPSTGYLEEVIKSFVNNESVRVDREIIRG